MAYSELIKNFEKIRAYMREFYVYGFKSREDYDGKSLRSYDDERRRMESWLGKHMRFVRTPEGKSMFISIDSRTSNHNPLYNALKAKSFTDGDITLHFALFDVLHDDSIALTLPQIMEAIDTEYLSHFDSPMLFDESTLRKKLKEYVAEGIVVCKKVGKRMVYSRAPDVACSNLADALDFYSEVAPCGVVGSFLHDKQGSHSEAFVFKHHYITSAIDSQVLCMLLVAMQSKSIVSVQNLSRKDNEPRRARIVPLRVLVSVQNGRQYLVGYEPDFNSIRSFRIDYLSNVKVEEPWPTFDQLRQRLDEMQQHMWGVGCHHNLSKSQRLEHVEFVIRVEEGEDYIVRRLYREKRIGRVEQIDKSTYKFVADVYESSELMPWIRSFVCRLVQLNFSNRTLENRLKRDVKKMYAMYGVEGGEDNDI
ncbi:MAG: WYL domain-containing protein [Clostridia bacterium]|nr:WYL domain-containing protein [Clostridia bacterium]